MEFFFSQKGYIALLENVCLTFFIPKCTRDYTTAYNFYLDDSEIVRGPINTFVNFCSAVFVPGYISSRNSDYVTIDIMLL